MPIRRRKFETAHLRIVVAGRLTKHRWIRECAGRQGLWIQKPFDELGWLLGDIGDHLDPVPIGLQARDPCGRNVVGQSNPEVDSERRRDLVREILPDRAPIGVGTTNEFGLVPPETDAVVAVARARLPRRRLLGQRNRQTFWIGEHRRIDLRIDCAQPGLVSEQSSYGDVGLAVLGKVRPMVGDEVIEAEQAMGRCVQDGHRSHAFGGREHIDDRVALPQSFGSRLRVATP